MIDDKGARGRVCSPILLELVHKRGWDLCLDLAVGSVWMLFAALYLNRILLGGDHLDAGLFLFNTLVACSFVRRRPAQHRGAWGENILAWGGTLLPIVGLHHATRGWVSPGLVVQSLALIGMIAALVSLGRSFGIAPADRGLVRSGLYHYVRHPLYATELLFNAGYLIANLSWRNLIAFVLFAVIQVVRLSREERIISGYAPYASRVRWRLVPLVW